MRSENEERVVLKVRPSPFRAHPVITAFSGLLVLAYGVGLIVLAMLWLDARSRELTITDKRTTLRTGLLSKNTSEVLHRDIRNIQVHQGALQRLLGVGSLGISSAGQSGIEISIANIFEPEGVRKLLDEQREV